MCSSFRLQAVPRREPDRLKADTNWNGIRETLGLALGRVLARNLLSNWAGFAVQAALTFVLTPFVLRELGEARYGVWALIVGLTGYYGLLDLGFRAGLTQYLTRYLALRDYERLNQTASTGFVALAGCGLLIMVASLALGWAAPSWFHLPHGLDAEVQTAILIVGGGAAAQFLFFPFSAVLTATQRFDLSNLAGISTRLLTGVATFACLEAGYGLIGLSLAVAGGNLLDYLLRWRFAYRVLPELRLSPQLARWRACWEFTQFGLWSVLTLAGVRLIAYSDGIVIGLFLPVAAITPFALAVSLTTYFQDAFAPIGHVFFPVATQLDAQGDARALRDLYLNGSRLLLLLAVGSGLIAGFWGADFFRLWIGPLSEAAGYPPASALFPVLLIGSVITAGQRVGYQVLLGTRRPRLLACLFAGEALINLALSVVLIQPLGLFGVALGTAIPALVFQGVVQPMVVGRLLGVSAAHYLRAVWLPPLALGLILTPILWCIRLLEPVPGWPGLLGQASLAGGAGLAVMTLVELGHRRSAVGARLSAVSPSPSPFSPMADRRWPQAAAVSAPAEREVMHELN